MASLSFTYKARDYPQLFDNIIKASKKVKAPVHYDYKGLYRSVIEGYERVGNQSGRNKINKLVFGDKSKSQSDTVVTSSYPIEGVVVGCGEAEEDKPLTHDQSRPSYQAGNFPSCT